MPPPNEDPSPHSPVLSKGAVHREQVWAALIHAVNFLLDDALDQIEEDLDRVQRSDDVERAERLLARARVVRELRREVSAPPP